MDIIKKQSYENGKVFLHNPIKKNFYFKKTKTENVVKDYIFLNKTRLLG